MMAQLSTANAELMDPILALMKASDKPAPVKIGVLIDAAATLLAGVPEMQNPHELRATSEEMRKRLIQVTRLHQDELKRRQQDATAAKAKLETGATKPPLRVVSGG